MSKEEYALKLFGNGYNCAQAVLAAFSDELGLDKDTALKLSTSFGGGVRSGEVCGAVSGALMVLGLKYGHSVEGDVDTKTNAYNLTIDFNNNFKKINNTIVCKELLGYNISNPDEHEMAMARHNEVCPKMIKDAVCLLEGMLE